MDENPALEWLRHEQEIAWSQGFASANNGRKPEDNPYRKATRVKHIDKEQNNAAG